MRLYALKDGTYMLHGVILTLEELLLTCESFNLKREELEGALVQMVRDGHSVAEFGDVNGTFLYATELEN